MTHNTETLEPSNFGNRDAYLHTINITSLDAAGSESYDPASEVNVADGPVRGVWPVGQDNRSVIYNWRHDLNALNVTLNGNVGTAGAEAPNNDAVGEVRLLVVGGGT